MAKNESESCVISLVSDKKIENATIEVVKGNEGFKVEVEKEHFISCNGVNWPDPLEPVTKFDIEADEIINLLVRFTTSTSTDAGKYFFTLALKDGDGEVIFNYTVRAKVWNFALPEKYVINTAMGLNRERIADKHGVTDKDEIQRLYEAYYELLLKNRVSAYTLPYDVLDDRADAFMSDPRVTSFVLNSHADDETLKKYHAKLSTNPDWMAKATFYPLDEPLHKEHLGTLIARCERLKRLCPGVRRTSPFFRNIQFTKDTDEIEILLEHCELMCPKITCYNDEFIYRILATDTDGSKYSTKQFRYELTCSFSEYHGWQIIGDDKMKLVDADPHVEGTWIYEYSSKSGTYQDYFLVHVDHMDIDTMTIRYEMVVSNGYITGFTRTAAEPVIVDHGIHDYDTKKLILVTPDLLDGEGREYGISFMLRFETYSGDRYEESGLYVNGDKMTKIS
jgi:hypothetical protein